MYQKAISEYRSAFYSYFGVYPNQSEWKGLSAFEIQGMTRKMHEHMQENPSYRIPEQGPCPKPRDERAARRGDATYRSLPSYLRSTYVDYGDPYPQ